MSIPSRLNVLTPQYLGYPGGGMPSSASHLTPEYLGYPGGGMPSSASHLTPQYLGYPGRGIPSTVISSIPSPLDGSINQQVDPVVPKQRLKRAVSELEDNPLPFLNDVFVSWNSSTSTTSGQDPYSQIEFPPNTKKCLTDEESVGNDRKRARIANEKGDAFLAKAPATNSIQSEIIPTEHVYQNFEIETNLRPSYPKLLQTGSLSGSETIALWAGLPKNVQINNPGHHQKQSLTFHHVHFEVKEDRGSTKQRD